MDNARNMENTMRTLILLGLFLTMSLQAQVFEITDVYICEKEREIKRIQRRFDRAVIARDYFGEPENFYMALDDDDTLEYYKRLGIKFYCIPKRKRDKVTLIMLFYEEGEWDNEEVFYNNI